MPVEDFYRSVKNCDLVLVEDSCNAETVEVQDSEFLPNTEKTVWFDDEITEKELKKKNETVDEESLFGGSVQGSSHVAHTRSVLETLDEIGDMIFFTKDLARTELPNDFDEAWDHRSPKERKGWRDSVSKGYKDMDNRRVWTRIRRKHVPKNRRLGGTKWCLHKKKGKRFRPRIMVKGFMEILGVLSKI